MIIAIVAFITICSFSGQQSYAGVDGMDFRSLVAQIGKDMVIRNPLFLPEPPLQ